MYRDRPFAIRGPRVGLTRPLRKGPCGAWGVAAPPHLLEHLLLLRQVVAGLVVVRRALLAELHLAARRGARTPGVQATEWTFNNHPPSPPTATEQQQQQQQQQQNNNNNNNNNNNMPAQKQHDQVAQFFIDKPGNCFPNAS